MVSCDQDVLSNSVTDSSIYEDMTSIRQKAMIYTAYDNITVYTVPGVNAQEFITYVICNLTIAGVNSRPLDIKSFYIKKTDSGYKIDNGVLNEDETDMIRDTNAAPSVQALYHKVMEDTNYCIENDQTFADFYSEINSNN